MYNKQNVVSEVLKGGEVATKAAAERVVETVFNNIMGAVKSGEKVSIAGFGIFSKKAVKARVGRNPRTGESVKIAAHGKVKFTVASAFKEAVK